MYLKYPILYKATRERWNHDYNPNTPGDQYSCPAA
jgi:hypothetical protein